MNALLSHPRRRRCALALAGKSSLLTVLGGRNRARITGTLRFNEHPLNKAMKRRMGFVTQDDLLYAEVRQIAFKSRCERAPA